MHKMDQSNNKPALLKSFTQLDFISKDNNLRRLLLITVLIFVVMSILVPNTFLTLRNFSSMAFQFPEFGLLAIAIMLAMLTGGIDLSIVGIANFSGILAALVLVKYGPMFSGVGIIIPILFAITVSVISGLMAGMLNGFLIARIGITPILATLGTMELLTGIGIVITRGSAVFGFPESFIAIGNGSIFYIPIPFIIFVLFAVAFSIVLNRTSFGFKLYMLGTNETASKFSGINNVKILIKTYMLSGFLSACAGIILIARTNSAKADYGTSYTLQAILVAVLGGVNPNGGFGSILGIVLAIFSLQFLSSGFNLLQISNFAKDFVWGALLLLVMVVNYILNKKKEKHMSKVK